MGTRADFYVGSDWIGSVAWDGYEWEELPDHPIMAATTEDEFTDAVLAELGSRDDATLPMHGWPWPWEDSRTTDFAYRFEDGKTKVYCFGMPIQRDEEDEMIDLPIREDWPNMKDKQNVTFGERSGVMFFSSGGKP